MPVKSTGDTADISPTRGAFVLSTAPSNVTYTSDILIEVVLREGSNSENALLGKWHQRIDTTYRIK